MQTALVTGAAGFVGSHLVDALLERGWGVRGLDDLSTGRRRNLQTALEVGSFELIEADVSDEAVVATAVEDVDAIFHQAALASVPGSFNKPRSTTMTNCLGTATLLDVARDAGVGTVVVASSSAVYGSSPPLPTREDVSVVPESPYALSKYYAERLALQIGEYEDLQTVALRYFNVFGPRQDPEGEYAAVIPAFIERMLNGDRPIVYGDGEQSRDFVYVDDVVEANLLAAEADLSAEVFNVAGGERITVNELLDQLNEVMGTNLEPIYEDPRPGDVRHSQADISKIRESLGYEPVVGFQEGLERTVDWYKSSGRPDLNH